MFDQQSGASQIDGKPASHRPHFPLVSTKSLTRFRKSRIGHRRCASPPKLSTHMCKSSRHAGAYLLRSTTNAAWKISLASSEDRIFGFECPAPSTTAPRSRSTCAHACPMPVAAPLTIAISQPDRRQASVFFNSVVPSSPVFQITHIFSDESPCIAQSGHSGSASFVASRRRVRSSRVEVCTKAGRTWPDSTAPVRWRQACMVQMRIVVQIRHSFHMRWQASRWLRARPVPNDAPKGFVVNNVLKRSASRAGPVLPLRLYLSGSHSGWKRQHGFAASI